MAEELVRKVRADLRKKGINEPILEETMTQTLTDNDRNGTLQHLASQYGEIVRGSPENNFQDEHPLLEVCPQMRGVISDFNSFIRTGDFGPEGLNRFLMNHAQGAYDTFYQTFEEKSEEK